MTLPRQFPRVRAACVLAVAFFGAHASALHAAGPTGKLEGRIRDPQGRPMARVKVAILGTSLGTATDSAGHYTLSMVPAGAISVEIRYLGYKTRQDSVYITPNVTTTLDDALDPTSLVADTKVSTSGRKGVPLRDDVISRRMVRMPM